MEVREDAACIWWTGPLKIDADGAADAYHPDGRSGRDYLANAGGPGNWYGLVTDKSGDPVIQGSGDPCPGFYVSPTSLQDRTKAVTDPRRYVDSALVPYVSVPKNALPKVKLGDVALVYFRETGKMCAAVVADTGPKNKWGEGSIALAKALGIPSSPKNGGVAGGVTVVIFKNSSRAWPRANSDVAQQTQDLLNAAGGDFKRYL